MATRPRRQPKQQGRGAPALRANVAELRALAHPLRLRVMELFAEGPRTTKQVAELLGQPPTRLYHHVNALERAGLLRLRETRPNRGAVEKWYEVATERLTTRPRRGGPGAPEHALVGAVLEQTRAEVTAALSSGGGGGQRPVVTRLIAVGSPARIAAIRERLGAFLAELRELDEADAERTPERWALTIAFAPAATASTEPRAAKKRSRRPHG